MKIFYSKFGYEILLFVLAVFIITYFLSGTNNFAEIIIYAFILLFIIYLNLTTKYIIDGNFLIVKSGFLINRKYEIQKIKSISKTRNLISSPAPSLDRIALRYGKFDEIILSPKNKNDFAAELQNVNPNIVNKL